MGRGIERRKIFRNDTDREDFLERLELATEGDRAFVYAWSLIPNHFHLAIRTGTRSLANVMRRLMTGYAVAFNRRYKRHGHLFQNRYKSTVVDDEAYLLGLVRYIHSNPLRAGLVCSVAALSRYPWTGHAALMGNAERPFQDVDEILRRFGRHATTARKHLVDFMSDQQAGKKEERLFKGGGLIRSAGGIEELRRVPKEQRQMYDERILGDGQFVEALLEKVEPRGRQFTGSESDAEERFTRIRETVCRRLNLGPDALGTGSRARQVVRARCIVGYVAGRYLGWSGKLAENLGISPSVVSRSIARGEVQIRELGWDMEELIP